MAMTLSAEALVHLEWKNGKTRTEELENVVYPLCGYVSVVDTLRAQAGAPVVQFDQVCNQMAMLFHCNKCVCGAPQLYGISIVTAEDNLGQLAISGCIQYAVARQRSVSMHHGLGQRRPLRLVCTNVKNPSIVGKITQGHVTEHHNHPREWKNKGLCADKGMSHLRCAGNEAQP
jgi:hypothetical protein